jgi:sugar lactone lactonase YvrE
MTLAAVPRWSAKVASTDVFGLGEGPLWDPPRRRVLWVDIDAGTVHAGELSGGHVVRRRSWHLDRTVGAVVCSAAGDLLVAGSRALITVTEAGSDAEGHLWVAIWGAGQVHRYAPDGQLAGIVDVPAPNTSSVAFVADGLGQLLITTATVDLSDEQLDAFPDSGRLFLADVGVTGQPVTPWSGA